MGLKVDQIAADIEVERLVRSRHIRARVTETRGGVRATNRSTSRLRRDGTRILVPLVAHLILSLVYALALASLVSFVATELT